MLDGALSRETFRELQLPVASKTPTFGVGIQSAESIEYAAYLCSQALSSRLLRKVVSSDVDISLDADKYSPAAHADLAESCEATPARV